MATQAEQLLGEVEFTHRWYRRFLKWLLADGYDFCKFSDQLGDRDVVLRHDVDLSVDAAVRMASIEADLDIRSTYCFLLSSPLYNPFEKEYRKALQKIDSLGHEVALHFDTHDYWDADTPPVEGEIERRINEEQSVLGTIVPTSETVSFHRPPSWVLDREFDGVVNTYAPAYFSDIGYIADSSQRWREAPPPFDDLPETMQLLTHPGLWAEDDGGFAHRIEQAITETCSHIEWTVHDEFVDGGSN
jgi:peptidoglycan/xylan/chitin deacetylase (PgdA/CDA1 family)